MDRFKQIFIDKLKKESLVVWILIIFILVLFNEYKEEKTKANDCFNKQIELLKDEVKILYNKVDQFIE